MHSLKNTMGLERLNILFFLINVTGALPYRMVLNKKNKRFERFDFEWWHPVTLWFVVVLITQLIYTSYSTIIIVIREISKSKERESVIYVMVMVLWLICYGVVKLIPAIQLFRVRNLITALTDLKKVDRILYQIPNKRCNSRQRTVIGFVCAISMITASEISASDRMLFLLETKEMIYSLLDFLADFITLLQFVTWLLLMHLTYYSIAHRIAILEYFICDQAPIHRGKKKVTVVPLKTSSIEPDAEQLSFRLQIVDNVFDRLAKTCNQLKCVFSFPALIVLLTSFFSSTINIFILLRNFIQPNSSHNNIFLYSVLLTSQIAMALIIIISADLPTQEIKRLRGKFLQLSTKKIDSIDEAKCAAILLAMSEERVQLSAGGLMPIGKELLPSLTATVITYLVILLQNAIHKKANQDKDSEQIKH